jgi:hypothetical protein
MPVIPPTPSFATASVAPIASLTSLSTLVKIGAQYQVAWRVYSTASQSIVANTTASVSWGGAAWNPDTSWASGTPQIITINTQGYYDMSLGLTLYAASSFELTVTYKVTHSATTTTYTLCAAWPFPASGTGSTASVLQLPAVIPQLLYVGDTLETYVLTAQSCSILQVGEGQVYSTSPPSTDYAGIKDGGSWWSGRLLSIGGSP